MGSAALTQREREALCDLFCSINVNNKKRWGFSQNSRQFYWARKKVLLRRFFRG